jgi:GTPase SAR1 family protein
MASAPNFIALAQQVNPKNQYEKQLNRLKAAQQVTDCIRDAVEGVMNNLGYPKQRALVIYGDPQSGKTEMMIALTGKLLDAGYKTLIHLMNDSVDLLVQNLDRFKLAGLAPAPRNSADVVTSPLKPGHTVILFCKKNRNDLMKLIDSVRNSGPVVVIDDEADYATPNAKINVREKTRINALVGDLLGTKGIYIGVTATPARLNLNNTFNNTTETWVRFKAHPAYTGQDVFFPLEGQPEFRLKQIDSPGTATDAREALARFLVTVAHLNLEADSQDLPERNYSFLVHTSGRTDDHRVDRDVIEKEMNALNSGSGREFVSFAKLVYDTAGQLYPQDDPKELAAYVIGNASRSTFAPGKKVSARTVNVSNVALHREEYGCDHAIVVGPDFPTGQGDDASLVKQVRANEAHTGKTITVVRTVDLARLVRLVPVKGVGLHRLRDFFTRCVTTQEAKRWIDQLQSEKPEQPPYGAILETIWALQKDVPAETVEFSAVATALRKDKSITLPKNEIAELCRSLSRMTPYVVVRDPRVELTQRPDRILQAAGAGLQNFPEEEQKRTIFRAAVSRK